MGAHSDDEASLGARPVVASASFGAARRFTMAAKPRGPAAGCERAVFSLGDGDVLVMEAGTQEAWKHAVPRQAGVDAPRISLTFRRIVAAPPDAQAGGRKRPRD